MAYYAAGHGRTGSGRWRGDRRAAIVTIVTVSFGAKFARSDQFKAVFREGMALVEAAANYLDGDGRKEARKLRPPHSLAYATESMRLTTRLMQLASWLLIRRAVSEGELTPEQAVEEQRKIKLPVTGSRAARPRSRRAAAAAPRADRAEHQASGAGDPARPDARYRAAPAGGQDRPSAEERSCRACARPSATPTGPITEKSRTFSRYA